MKAGEAVKKDFLGEEDYNWFLKVVEKAIWYYSITLAIGMQICEQKGQKMDSKFTIMKFSCI
jgi:hypothetical protein